MHSRGRHSTRGGFTLIELLVVVAVIAILASLLMPAITRAMEHSATSTCMGHMRQLTQGCILYASNHSLIITIQYIDGSGRERLYQQSLIDADKADPRALQCPAESQFGPDAYDDWYSSWSRTGAPMWWYAYNRAYGLVQLGRPHCAHAANKSEHFLTTEVKRPSQIVFWADACYYAIYHRQGCDPNYPEDRSSIMNRRLSFRHMDGLNLVYHDYHGEWMLGKEIHPRMWVPKWK